MVAAAAALALGACASGGAANADATYGFAGAGGARAAADFNAHAFASAVDMGEVDEARLAVARASDPRVREFAQMMIAEHATALQDREAMMDRRGLGMEAGLRIQGVTWNGAATAQAASGTRHAGQSHDPVVADRTGIGVAGGKATGGGMSGREATVASGGNGHSPAVSAGDRVPGQQQGHGQHAGHPAGGTGGAGMLPAPGPMHAMLMAHPVSQPVMAGGMRSMQSLSLLSGAAFDRAYMDHQVSMHRYTLEQMDRMMADPATAPSGELAMVLRAQRASVAAHLQRAQQIRASLR